MLVSIVIPAREWDSLLIETLASIRGQRLPPGVVLETIVGLASVHRSDAPTGVRIVHNPSGTIPDALNRAIVASTGSIVIRVDARCNLQPDHVARVIDRLADPAVGCVGGAALVLDRGLFGSAYAVAFNSPLLGPSSYRYRATSGAAETAYLGAWRRSDLLHIGGFDARLIRNQDNELSDRVRKSGRIVYYDADLVTGYTSGRHLRAALAHHYEFGMWRMIQASHGQRSLSSRQVLVVATAATGGVLTAGLLANPSARRGAMTMVGAAYLIAAATAYSTSSRLRRARPDIVRPDLNPLGMAIAPALAVAINIAWITGMTRGAIAAFRSSRSSHLTAGVLDRRDGDGPARLDRLVRHRHR